MADPTVSVNPVLAHILAQKATPEQEITHEAVEGFNDGQFVDSIVKFQEAHAEGISRNWPPGTNQQAKAMYEKVWAHASERLIKGKPKKR